MLQNAYFLAKIGAGTAENEQHFAEILPIGRRVAVDVRGFDHVTGSPDFATAAPGHSMECPSEGVAGAVCGGVIVSRGVKVTHW